MMGLFIATYLPPFFTVFFAGAFATAFFAATFFFVAIEMIDYL